MELASRQEPRAGLLLARIAVGLVLAGVTVMILLPFLVPAVWAATIAYMTWGPYQSLSRATGRPRASAFLFTLATFLVLGIPAVWMLVLALDESIHLIAVAQEWIRAGAPLPAWISEIPWLGPPLQRLLAEPLEGIREVAPRLLAVGKALSQQVLSVAGGVAENAFAFLVTLLTLYVFYSEGEQVAVRGRRLVAYLFPRRPADYLDQVGGVVRAVVLGVLGTALAQGTVAGVGFAIFGVPYAVGLGALTGLLSLLPGGTFATALGASLWLVAQHQNASAIGMMLWGVLFVGTLDSWLRPLLIRRSGSGEIPFLLILFGVLGGLSAFGLPGLLFGPVMLAVVFALVAELPPAVAAGEGPAGGIAD
jgi:predicted PurR-regulated permease PerM